MVGRKERTAGLRTDKSSARCTNKPNCSRHTLKTDVDWKDSYAGELGYDEPCTTAYHAWRNWESACKAGRRGKGGSVHSLGDMGGGNGSLTVLRRYGREVLKNGVLTTLCAAHLGLWLPWDGSTTANKSEKRVKVTIYLFWRLFVLGPFGPVAILCTCATQCGGSSLARCNFWPRYVPGK